MKELNFEQAVRNLQLYLRTISFFDSRIGRVPIDGIYENDTKRAVASFQRTRDLPVSEAVDKATWDTIYQEYLQILQSTEEIPIQNLFPSAQYGYSVGRGEESSFVAVLQLMLRELALLFDEFPEITVDGIYGNETEQAVRAFQRAALLEESGRVDMQTYNRLNSAFLTRSLYLS